MDGEHAHDVSWTPRSTLAVHVSPAPPPAEPAVMILRSLAATALLAGTAAFAQSAPELVVPPASRLQPLGAPGAAAPVAFEGRTTVHAILIAQWVPNAQGDGLPGPVFHLLPVPQSALQLPHFAGTPLRFLSVPDGRGLLERATNGEIAAEFAARKLRVVHVEGLFTITALVVGTGCATAGEARLLDADPIRVRFP